MKNSSTTTIIKDPEFYLEVVFFLFCWIMSYLSDFNPGVVIMTFFALTVGHYLKKRLTKSNRN